MAENYFGHALAYGPVVVYFREAQVFEGEMAKTGYGFVGGELLGADLLEQFMKAGSIHADGYCIGVGG
ncbi:MAG: hypothetical protein WA609_09315 [Terriglobales bacterium]